MAKDNDEGGSDDAGADLEDGVGSFFDKSVKGGKDGADDDDAGEGDEDDEGDDEGEEGEDDDAGEGDDDDAGEGGEEGEDDDDEGEEGEEGEGEDDDDEEDDEPEGDELDPSFRDAADRHKLPTRFDDIVRALPKAAQAKARVAFATRLKEMESGLNRAFIEARGGRKELATLKAEREYVDANPLEHVLELMEKDPEFVTKLNDELEKMETKAYAEAKKMRRDDAKTAIKTKADQLEAAQAHRDERVAHVTSLARKLASKEGIPYRFAERALYVAITKSPTGDVTDADIRRVVADEAKEFRKATGERKRETRKDYVRDKVRDRESSRRRPTGRDRGHAPAPGRVREPRSLEEALTRRAAKILPDAPAS